MSFDNIIATLVDTTAIPLDILSPSFPDLATFIVENNSNVTFSAEDVMNTTMDFEASPAPSPFPASQSEGGVLSKHSVTLTSGEILEVPENILHGTLSHFRSFLRQLRLSETDANEVKKLRRRSQNRLHSQNARTNQKKRVTELTEQCRQERREFADLAEDLAKKHFFAFSSEAIADFMKDLRSRLDQY